MQKYDYIFKILKFINQCGYNLHKEINEIM
jgi:hypothetical protein